LLDAAQQPPVLIGKDRRSTVGAIDMQPQIVAPAYFSDGHKIVHRSGVCSSGCSDYAKGLFLLSNIRLYRPLQDLWIKLHVLIHGDAPQRFAPNSEQASRFIDRVMSLVGGIEDRLCTNRSDAFLDRVLEL